MKLGIYLNAQHPAGDDPRQRFAETLEQARLIRSLGFDSIWGGEHHATPGFHYFPLLPMLQRLAAEVDGLAIGTNLVLLPLHNPVELAEIGAFLFDGVLAWVAAALLLLAARDLVHRRL